ncbi:MAG TPA: BolA family protein [Patescibacteria group bacterium]|nr:BolA family protein [Patescibacteria group bacterium]
MSALSTQQTIETRLKERLAPIHLEVIDDSPMHAGHAGAASGGGHFSVLVVSPSFEGIGRVARHRLVYDVLQDMMQGAIHALALRTIAPSEWSR